jgi:hypothetical protein
VLTRIPAVFLQWVFMSGAKLLLHAAQVNAALDDVVVAAYNRAVRPAIPEPATVHFSSPSIIDLVCKSRSSRVLPDVVFRGAVPLPAFDQDERARQYAVWRLHAVISGGCLKIGIGSLKITYLLITRYAVLISTLSGLIIKYF